MWESPSSKDLDPYPATTRRTPPNTPTPSNAKSQIVVKLEKAEALRGEGMSVAQACRVLGISEATLCRWRQRYGSMSRSEAKELRELREQNARLKQLLGQAELEKAALRELAEGNF